MNLPATIFQSVSSCRFGGMGAENIDEFANDSVYLNSKEETKFYINKHD